MEISVELRTVRRVLAWVAVVAGWTALAYPFVAIGFFFAADTSCDGGELHASADGVWWEVMTVSVWASPFLVVAGLRRTVVTIGAAVLAVAAAAGMVAWVATSPGQFCF
ncbi:hypothetical protein [Williamsia sp. M5A3_1d]